MRNQEGDALRVHGVALGVVHRGRVIGFGEIVWTRQCRVDHAMPCPIARGRGPLATDELCVVAEALCQALAAVHRAGLVHQDVKAQNVMQDNDGRLVLMDLGASTGETGRPRWGTPSYMAPELFVGGVASAQSDLYSLGVLTFVLATAEFPVEGRTYEEIAGKHARREVRRLGDLRPDLPRGFLEAIDRVLDVDPAARFPTAGRLAAAIPAGAR